MITEANISRIRKHILKVAQDKNLDINAVNEIIENRCDIRYIRTHGLGTCRDCGTAKHEMNGFGKAKHNGKRYAYGIVYCPKCEWAITVYINNDEGCTPIRPDQKNVKQYPRKCNDCGRKFTITARTWEKLKEQTTHKCRGKVVDLIADEHRHLTGIYNPFNYKEGKK